MKGLRNWFGQFWLMLLGSVLFINPLMSQPPALEKAKIPAQGGDRAEAPIHSPNVRTELTEEQKKELVRKNEVAKKLAESFFKSGVWNWDDIKCTSDISAFAHYNIGYQVKCVKFVEEKKDYGTEGFIIDGAEYRYNLALMRGFGGYKKLDADAQKVVNKEIFGQETRPTKDTQAFVDGLNKCLEIQRIIGSEYAARPLAPDDKSKENQPMNSKPMTDKPANPMKNDGSTSMIINEETFYAMFDVLKAPKPTKTLE